MDCSDDEDGYDDYENRCDFMLQGCSSPIVVKFADTQKDKDAKRQQQLQASLLNNLTTAAAVNPITPHYFSVSYLSMYSNVHIGTICCPDLLMFLSRFPYVCVFVSVCMCVFYL